MEVRELEYEVRYIRWEYDMFSTKYENVLQSTIAWSTMESTMKEKAFVQKARKFVFRVDYL